LVDHSTRTGSGRLMRCSSAGCGPEGPEQAAANTARERIALRNAYPPSDSRRMRTLSRNWLCSLVAFSIASW